MRKEVARSVSDLMVKFGAELDESVARVKRDASSAEFERYREAVSKLMFTMLVEIMNPLYAEHPDLKPEGLD